MAKNTVPPGGGFVPGSTNQRAVRTPASEAGADTRGKKAPPPPAAPSADLDPAQSGKAEAETAGTTTTRKRKATPTAKAGKHRK